MRLLESQYILPYYSSPIYKIAYIINLGDDDSLGLTTSGIFRSSNKAECSWTELWGFFFWEWGTARHLLLSGLPTTWLIHCTHDENWLCL